MNDKMEKELRKEYPEQRKHDYIRSHIVNNIGFKILSLIIAIVVWVAIVNIEDPYKERTFHVNVETVNEEALSSVNKVYEVIEGNIAIVKVKGKKSILDRLKAEDIRATADLSSLSAVNAVSIVPELKKSFSEEPELECDTVFKVSLENLATKQVKVNVMTTGTPQDGYSIGECMARPNMLEVSGGEKVINKIDAVRVLVNVNGVSEDFHKKAAPVAYDSDGGEITSSTLKYGAARVRVTVHVLKTKTIPVNINISGTPAEGFEYVSTECQPEEIQVAGSKDSLEQVSEVNVPINIHGMKSTSGYVEQNISIQDYLPDGIAVLEEYAQVSLRIGIEKKVKKNITVPVEEIRFASLADNLEARIHHDDDYIELSVEGLSSDLDVLEKDFIAYVDCKGLKKGRHRLTVKLNLTGSSITVAPVKVTVLITHARAEKTPEASAGAEETEAPGDDVQESAAPSEDSQ